MKKTAMDEQKKIENKKQRKQKSQNERNRKPKGVYILGLLLSF